MRVFERTGKVNTEETIELAAERGEELDIETYLVATTSGATALAAAERLEGRRVVAVTHSTGFGRPGVQEADPSLLARLAESDAELLTATHAFGGVGRAVRRKLKTFQVDEIIAQTLRLFGQGTKVAVEMALMAADAGLAPVDEDVIGIAGTGRGADTAVVLGRSSASRISRDVLQGAGPRGAHDLTRSGRPPRGRPGRAPRRRTRRCCSCPGTRRRDRADARTAPVRWCRRGAH